MPGIFAIAATQVVASKFLESVYGSHAVGGVRFLESSFSFKECALVSLSRVQREQSVYVAGDATACTAVVLVEGEIHNRDQLCARKGASADHVARVLYENHVESGDRTLDVIDGEFNIVIYEPSAGRLTAYSDHVGSHPLYYWHTGSQLLIGSEKKCLLAASESARRLDPVGLLQPFVHQHNLEERTLVEGLCRMRPASKLTYERGRLQVAAYRTPRGSSPSAESASGLLDRWEHELKGATARRLAGKSRLLISLSAGQDSRAIACSIDRSRRPIVARTWGHAGSFEVRYAREIARALGFDHRVENPFDFTLSAGVRPIVWRTDGETDFRNGLSMFTHAAMRPIADDVIGGWLGDISSGAHLRPFMLAPMKRAEFVRKVFRWYIQHDIDDLHQVFTKKFLDRYWPAVREAFFESYRRFDGLPNTQAHELWDMQNRQTRMTVSSMPVDSHLFGKIRPFFDRSYLDFTATIPVRWRIGQSLYKSLISRIGPEIRRIPSGNTNVRNYLSPVANLAGYGRTLSDKALVKLVSPFRAGSRKPGHDNVAAELMRHNRRDRGMRKLIEGFLASRHFDGSIFDRAAIERMLERHYSGVSDRFELIAILASYAVALEYFVYERTMTCPPEAQPFV